MVVLSTHRLGARFGSRQVLRDVTLPPCYGGEVVAVIGPNAAGKSTLFRRSAQVLLLYHRQNYDCGPEALGLGRAARYFVAEVDGIDQEGTN
jgi:ABC-type phosphate transport system ATPase subunit